MGKFIGIVKTEHSVRFTGEVDGKQRFVIVTQNKAPHMYRWCLTQLLCSTEHSKLYTEVKYQIKSGLALVQKTSPQYWQVIEK